jgi:integrase
MATILPILRSLLAFFHTTGLISKNLSGIVMGCFVQRCSVAAYLSEKDQVKLIAQLAKESKRTKAVILLAMHLGLRDCDICNLTFQVIDWQDDRITNVKLSMYTFDEIRMYKKPTLKTRDSLTQNKA